MAIRLADVYSNSQPASADYPGGGFKNSTSAGGLDGTPLDQAWANDFLGFFQALLLKAGITPNGTPDTARASQYLDALRMLTDPLGSTRFGFWTLPPSGYLELNGQAIGSASAGAYVALKSADYRPLFNLLWDISTAVLNGTTGGNQAKAVNSDTDWNAGNGVIVPDMRGCVPRGWDHGRGLDPGRQIGSYQADAQQNITGTFGADDQTRSQLGGAFYEKQGWNYDASSSGGGGGYQVGFDSSRQVRTATEVRMKNVAGMWVIRY